MAENESLQDQLKRVNLNELGGDKPKTAASPPIAPAASRPAESRPSSDAPRDSRPPSTGGGRDYRSRDGAPSSGGYRSGGPGGSRDSGPRRFGRRDDRFSKRRRFSRRKVCPMCVDKMKHIDYKDVALLRRFLTERSKVRPARMTGVCSTHQRQLTTAIKRARNIALLGFKS